MPSLKEILGSYPNKFFALVISACVFMFSFFVLKCSINAFLPIFFSILIQHKTKHCKIHVFFFSNCSCPMSKKHCKFNVFPAFFKHQLKITMKINAFPACPAFLADKDITADQFKTVCSHMVGNEWVAQLTNQGQQNITQRIQQFETHNNDLFI